MSTFDTYANYYNLPAGSDSLDSDHCGIPNLLGYFMGRNPGSAFSPPVLTFSNQNGALAVTFNRNTDATDVSISVEAATTLSGSNNWSPILQNIHGAGWSGTASLSATSLGAGLEQDTVQDVIPISSGTTRFLRLRVTRP